LLQHDRSSLAWVLGEFEDLLDVLEIDILTKTVGILPSMRELVRTCGTSRPRSGWLVTYRHARFRKVPGNVPTNPGEVYFTNSTPSTSSGVSFMNNVIVATGVSPRGSTAIINQPTSGWSNNVAKRGC
jgi:hypothetical protein